MAAHFRSPGFCESRFRSLLLSGTLTMSVFYMMLLCDSIIAGQFIGTAGVAAINAVKPAINAVTFCANLISNGTAILYSRRIGADEKRRADEIFGQGLLMSLFLGILSAVLLYFGQALYFSDSGIPEEIRGLACAYYRWTPLYALLNIITTYLTQMVYTDGDEACNNISYTLQIGGKIAFSLLLVHTSGMVGIMLGTILGSALSLLAVCIHFSRRSNTLHPVWHLAVSDLGQIVRFSIVDASIYLCWAVADYVLVRYVGANYGQTGLITLAVVFSVLESGVVLDGVGLAIQPLLGIYLGEQNHVMVRRLMRVAVWYACQEGIFASGLLFLFAGPYCGLLGITGAAVLPSAIRAVRIVSLGLVFCSIVSILTSYYLLIDRVALATAITVLKDGILYSLLPLAGAGLAGQDGMWAAFTLAPLAALLISALWILLRYGRSRFPHLLAPSDTEIIVLDEHLTRERCGTLSERVQQELQLRNLPSRVVLRAAVFTEEIGLTVLEKNGTGRTSLLAEISLFFSANSLLIIERDSGMIFDITDVDQQVSGLSSFVLSSLMEVHRDKTHLTTTGYNRNIIRFELAAEQ